MTASATRLPLQFDRKRQLGGRVHRDGYYTNGRDLVEVLDVSGATGCVIFADTSTLWQRCLGIEDFRAEYWLCATRGETA